MPSKTARQARTMRALAHGWRPSKGSVSKIPRDVAIEFARADMAKKRKRPRRRTIAEGN